MKETDVNKVVRNIECMIIAFASLCNGLIDVV